MAYLRVGNAQQTTQALGKPHIVRPGYHPADTSQSSIPHSLGLGNGPRMKGPVSRACNERTHFEYHNEDRFHCGDGTKVAQSDGTPQTTITTVIVLPCTNCGGDNGGDDKNKCNKASRNGSEGCDPGNNPDNGNNDEGGDKKPDNSNGGNGSNSDNDNKGGKDKKN